MHCFIPATNSMQADRSGLLEEVQCAGQIDLSTRTHASASTTNQAHRLYQRTPSESCHTSHPHVCKQAMQETSVHVAASIHNLVNWYNTKPVVAANDEYLKPTGYALTLISPPCGMYPTQKACHCIQALPVHKVRNLCQLWPIITISVDDTSLHAQTL